MCIENQWIGVAVVVNSRFSPSIMTAPDTCSINDKSVGGVVVGTVVVEVEVTFPIVFNIKAESCHATKVALCTNNHHGDLPAMTVDEVVLLVTGDEAKSAEENLRGPLSM